MKIRLNDFIVQRLEGRKDEILNLCPKTTQEIVFDSDYVVVSEVFDVMDTDGTWISVENPVQTQAIQILTYEVFSEGDTKENCIEIQLNENTVSGRYFQNAGISLEATLAIIKVIEEVKGIKQLIK